MASHFKDATERIRTRHWRWIMTATQKLYESESGEAILLTDGNAALAQPLRATIPADFHSDFRRALHTSVGERIQTLLPALVVGYLGLSMMALVLRPVS